MQWRGGILYAAYKGKGSIADPENHRSLYVSSILGKAYHRLLRDQNQGALQGALHELHLGSRRRSPIQFASLSKVSKTIKTTHSSSERRGPKPLILRFSALAETTDSG